MEYACREYSGRVCSGRKYAGMGYACRCKLLGKVASGEITSFAELGRPEGGNSLSIKIYANDENLTKILEYYKLPSEWWEQAMKSY